MRKLGFTLIELLIVVAIIAILAAIAVPNFLEAQTRAKTTRVLADLRSVATALETYKIDTNHYPFDFASDVWYAYYLNLGLTTPVNYISNANMLQDVFAQHLSGANNGVLRRFRYKALAETWMSQSRPGIPWSSLPGQNAPGIVRGKEVHGAYMLVSKGPDKSTGPLPAGYADGNGVNDFLWQLYNATNGTLSRGDIIRSQKNPDINGTGYSHNVSY